MKIERTNDQRITGGRKPDGPVSEANGVDAPVRAMIGEIRNAKMVETDALLGGITFLLLPHEGVSTVRRGNNLERVLVGLELLRTPH